MRDAQLVELAKRQHHRIAHRQLRALGLSANAITHRLELGYLLRRREGVYATAPLLDTLDARWMEATLTTAETSLCGVTAACAWGTLTHVPPIDSVVRPGSGGPRMHDGIRVFRSRRLEGETTTIRGIPVTTIERTLLDLAVMVGDRVLARAVRESVRLHHTSLAALGDSLGQWRGRRGTPRLAAAVAKYSGLPIERARSGAEIKALEILRDAGRQLPRLNFRIDGEEADLVWMRQRLIVEIDGGPFHLDEGEDARKQEIWEAAGFEVRRLLSDEVYANPAALLALAP